MKTQSHQNQMYVKLLKALERIRITQLAKSQ